MEKVTGQELIEFLSYLSSCDLADTQSIPIRCSMENYPFPANVIFYDSSVIYSIMLPGVKKENIEISGTGNYMMVSVKAEIEKEIEHMKSNKVEFTRVRGVRKFPIIDEMMLEDATAVLKDGILTISVPVRRSQDTTYKIEIK